MVPLVDRDMPAAISSVDASAGIKGEWWRNNILWWCCTVYRSQLVLLISYRLRSFL